MREAHKMIDMKWNDNFCDRCGGFLTEKEHENSNNVFESLNYCNKCIQLGPEPDNYWGTLIK